jgi:hypothetical protein
VVYLTFLGVGGMIFDVEPIIFPLRDVGGEFVKFFHQGLILLQKLHISPLKDI